MEVLLQETQLGNRDSSIIFENAKEELGDEDGEQEEDEEELKTLQYPISVAGMKYFLERLLLKSTTLSKTKQKSLDKLKQLLQNFKDCIG